MLKHTLSLLAVIALSGCVAPGEPDESSDDDEDVGSAEEAVSGAACSTMTTDAQKALAAINDVRTKMGMPAINCNDKIQKAAINHAKYQGLNNTMTHQEVQGKPGFTGVNFWDRMTAAGFQGSAAYEVISGNATGSGTVSSLMDTVLHRVPFASFWSGSYGFGNYVSGGTAKYGTIDFANISGSPSAGARAIWPIANATGVKTSFNCTSESPNPCDAGYTVVGYPISLSAGSGLTNVVTKLVKTGSATGLGHMKKIVANNTQVYLIPKAQLAASTSYTVTVSGTQNGSNFTKTWSFKTQ